MLRWRPRGRGRASACRPGSRIGIARYVRSLGSGDGSASAVLGRVLDLVEQPPKVALRAAELRANRVGFSSRARPARGRARSALLARPADTQYALLDSSMLDLSGVVPAEEVRTLAAPRPSSVGAATRESGRACSSSRPARADPRRRRYPARRPSLASARGRGRVRQARNPPCPPDEPDGRTVPRKASS